MPVPQQRDLEVARTALHDVARGPARRRRRHALRHHRARVHRVLERDAAVRRRMDRAGGERQRQGMVARVKPTGYTIFLESVFEEQYRVMEALGRHTDVLVPAGDRLRARRVGARRAVLRHGEDRRPHPRGQPAVPRRGLGHRRSRPTERGDDVVERHRTDGAGPPRRLARAGARLPRRPAARATRHRAAARLLRASTSSGRPRAGPNRSPRPRSSGCRRTGRNPTSPSGCAGATRASAT